MPPGVAVSPSRPPVDSLKVHVLDNRIIVADAPAHSRLEIYNIVGVKVKEMEIEHPSEEYVISLPRVYYILRIEKTVRKIVIR